MENEQLQCRTCKQIKPPERFRVRSDTGKRRSICQDCENIEHQERRKKKKTEQKAPIKESIPQPVEQNVEAEADKSKKYIGIKTWEQVDSVIREIGQIEEQIRREKNRRNSRILRIKDESDRVIDLFEKKQRLLYDMIGGFAQEQYSQAFVPVKKLRFGAVRIVKGELEVQVDFDLAAARIGRP